MRVSWIRAAQAAVTTLAAVAATVALTGVAQAVAVDDGRVAFSGGPDDFVTGGQSYKYDTVAGDWLGVDHRHDVYDMVTVDVAGSNGDWWTLVLAAPSGQELVPGTTYEASKYPFNGTGAGLSLTGNGRSCEELTGGFTVLEAVFGPYGYVERFAATFEQHCAGSADAATGEVHIVNPTPPAPLTIDATTTSGTFGKVNGNANLAGTATCSEPVGVSLEGRVTQVVKGTIVRGEFTAWADCTPGEATPWTATVEPDGTAPFRRGKAEVSMTAGAYDVDYDAMVRDPSTTIVRLTRA